MSMEGFVMVGRGELLLSLLAVALLMCALGYLLAQVVVMARRPKPLKLRPMTPEDEERGRKMIREMCTGPHCDDTKQMGAWLRGKNFSLITNEVLSELQADRARFRNRPTTFEVPKSMTPEQEQQLIDAIKKLKRPTGTPQWPGGDPDGV